jgi:hypothetical protein
VWFGWWTPAIPATQELEAGGQQDRGQSWQSYGALISKTK